jgi:ABC-type dipeptide/oligopeptide/nickel transport system permease component
MFDSIVVLILSLLFVFSVVVRLFVGVMWYMEDFKWIDRIIRILLFILVMILIFGIYPK